MPALSNKETIALAEKLIITVYSELAIKKQDWVSLRRVRPEVEARLGAAGVDCTLWAPAFTRAATALLKTGQVHLAPDSNRKVLTDNDHLNAVQIGSHAMHLLAVEPDFPPLVEIQGALAADAPAAKEADVGAKAKKRTPKPKPDTSTDGAKYRAPAEAAVASGSAGTDGGPGMTGGSGSSSVVGRGGGAGGGGAGGSKDIGKGTVSAAAEALVRQLVKPTGNRVETGKGLDRHLGDTSNALEILSKGIQDAAKMIEGHHPEQTGIVEGLGRQARQTGQVASAVNGVRSGHRRKEAADFERWENPRKNERGRDFGEQDL
jgi:hypothetical protein